jgi:hypothetical protein
LYCSCLFIFRALYAKIAYVVFALFMFGVTATVMVILWISLIQGIRTVDKFILAHMVMIYRAGINPYSTPIYFKHIIYTFLAHVTIIFFSGSVVIMSLELAGGLSAWVKDMLVWILNIGLLSSLAFLFRSRKVECCGYLRFEEGEELNVEYLESINEHLLDDQNPEELMQWEEGMVLPPFPRVNG